MELTQGYFLVIYTWPESTSCQRQGLYAIQGLKLFVLLFFLFLFVCFSLFFLFNEVFFIVVAHSLKPVQRQALFSLIIWKKNG